MLQVVQGLFRLFRFVCLQSGNGTKSDQALATGMAEWSAENVVRRLVAVLLAANGPGRALGRWASTPWVFRLALNDYASN